MTTRLPVLQTTRLAIRPFVPADFEAIHPIMVDCFGSPDERDDEGVRAARRSWLLWAIDNERELAALMQPPYGERAVTLHDGTLIGAVGLVPDLKPFEQIPYFRGDGPANTFFTAEVGLFWAIGPAWQRRGYATEAARALVDAAFSQLNLRRIVAGTDHTNLASIGVMRALGMRIERNPLPEPFWFQTVAVLERAEESAQRTGRR